MGRTHSNAGRRSRPRPGSALRLEGSHGMALCGRTLGFDRRSPSTKKSLRRTSGAHEFSRPYVPGTRGRKVLAECLQQFARFGAAGSKRYLNAMQSMGTGLGLRAMRYRRDAQEAMTRAYRAVPCWVLPQWRVSETIPSEVGLFDLVIIDEASQSDNRP